MFHVNDNEGCRLICWGCLWKNVGYDLFLINKVRHITCFPWPKEYKDPCGQPVCLTFSKRQPNAT